ncbi:MAG TPA: hypothetical protein VE988_03480, partial [Gemmataceae bacterium]|nr:hypothetical protein [Gemmataceae bacterium]
MWGLIYWPQHWQKENHSFFMLYKALQSCSLGKRFEAVSQALNSRISMLQIAWGVVDSVAC